ncbi:MAG: HIT domain-containing protein [bacterium]|nr:HIT domain-containing protein [bacterium]
MFELHHRLKEDCFELGSFKLCTLLLLNDMNYKWFILVPRRENISEIFQLTAEDRHDLTEESSYLSASLFEIFKADKMNVASLGNIVPQLHLHHIVRYKNDPAWPGPVWGHVPALLYQDDEKKALINMLSPLFQGDLGFQSLNH